MSKEPKCRIFINYRRGDDPGYTMALYERLGQEFAASDLFMDVEGRIKPGEDFVTILKQEVAECDVLLAVIGKNWLEVRDKDGGRRLDNPNDFVRIEIASALRLCKHIIPVLVNGARMPSAESLPEELKPLARRNAVRLTLERFKSDVQGLMKGIKGALAEKSSCTWGLRVTGVNKSAFTGRGIKIAVLGTGFDGQHPDFAGRKVVSRSFVDDGVRDSDGHSTHCIGIAMGPRVPKYGNVPRYGCVPDAEIYAGKVVYNDGFGWLNTVLNGIDWAIGENCRIINLSLGLSRIEGNLHSDKYLKLLETIGDRSLRKCPGTLIVAASGNQGDSLPVLPAYCKSVLSVGAIDEKLRETTFSNYGADVLAPGVDILSSVPRNLGLHKKMSGTSMATAHVAGIAALWAEALEREKEEPATAEEIRQALIINTRGRIIHAP